MKMSACFLIPLLVTGTTDSFANISNICHKHICYSLLFINVKEYVEINNSLNLIFIQMYINKIKNNKYELCSEGASIDLILVVRYVR